MRAFRGGGKRTVCVCRSPKVREVGYFGRTGDAIACVLGNWLSCGCAVIASRHVSDTPLLAKGNRKICVSICSFALSRVQSVVWLR